MEKKSDRVLAWLMSGLFGVFAGAFLIFGYQLETIDHIDLTNVDALRLLPVFILVITIDTYYVWRNYDYAQNGGKLFGFIKLPKWGEEKETTKKQFWLNYLFTALLSVPVILAEYPGFFVYDAQEELNEVLTRSFSTHHPLLHVLLLGGTIALFHKITGSWNVGILCYIILQMLVITGIFAYVITYIQRCKAGQKARVLWILYYGAFPTIVMYTLCSCKDGLFSALLLLLTVYLIQLVKDMNGFVRDRKKVALFILTAALMPMFRHNGFYAYLVFVPFGIIYFRKNLNRILVAMLVVPVILYLVSSSFLRVMCNAAGTHHQEMLTVPIMQLARVYAYDGEDLSPDDKAVIEAYVPREDLLKYSPRIADLVKVNFNNELYERDRGSFWKVWSKTFTKHPVAYLNAWLLTCYGYLYPPAIINVYKGNTVYTFTYEDSSYFGYEVEPPGERKSFIPAIDDFYRYLSIGTFQQDQPVLHLFFSPGFYLFIYMFVFAYRLYKKKFGGILPFLPMILTFMTVILGPTYLIRYVLYFWLCAPLLTVTGQWHRVRDAAV